MVCLCSRDKASQSRFDHFHGQRWIALDVAMWRMILPYFASLLDTRVERTLLNMNASETSTDFQILRVPFLIDNRDSRHCCPDLHPGESSWSWTRCPLPRLGYGAQMEPSWLTWHGIWSQTHIFFDIPWNIWNSFRMFQRIEMLTTLTCTPEAYLPLVPDSADQDMGTKILTVLDDLRWGAGNSQCFHFSSLSAALHFVAPGFGKRWRRHVLWYVVIGFRTCGCRLVQLDLACHTPILRTGARLVLLAHWSFLSGIDWKALYCHLTVILCLGVRTYIPYIYIYYFIFDQRRGKQDNFSILRSAISEWRQDGPCLAKKNLRKRWRRRF